LKSHFLYQPQVITPFQDRERGIMMARYPNKTYGEALLKSGLPLEWEINQIMEQQDGFHPKGSLEYPTNEEHKEVDWVRVGPDPQLGVHWHLKPPAWRSGLHSRSIIGRPEA
jgi:hypothetical protein